MGAPAMLRSKSGSAITSGLAGWPGVAVLGLLMLTVPLMTGLREMRQQPVAEKPQEKLSPGV